MSQEELAPLSAAETEILRLVWEKDRATVQQVTDSLPEGRTISAATVQTLLRRLEKKGYLEHSREGRAHVFFPAVAQEQVIGRSVGDFIDRLFAGNPLPLVQHLAQAGQISKDDLKRLQSMLDSGENDDG